MAQRPARDAAREKQLAQTYSDIPAIGRGVQGLPRAGKYVGPRLISAVSPIYPDPNAPGRGNGSVLVAFIVDTTGQVRVPRVVKSTANYFEAPALEAVLKWRFAPGTLDGKPVNLAVEVPVDFVLTNPAKDPRS